MLVVTFTHWPVAVFPESFDLAGAVIERGRVIALSALAERDGVALGQRIKEAERCSPGMRFFLRDPAAEFHAFAPVIETVQEMAPHLVVQEPGWIAIPTRGPARYFGGERALVHALSRALRACARTQGTQYRFTIGIAEGSFGATFAAQAGVIVEPGATAKFLADLPIRLIDDLVLSDLLERLGVTTLGALARLPEEDVLARFGTRGFLAQQRASARETTMYAHHGGDGEIVVIESFDEPITGIEHLLHRTELLAETFGELLCARGLRCTICELRAIAGDGSASTRLWQHRYSWEPRALTERMRWQLESWMDQRNGIGDGEVRESAGVVTLSMRAHEVIDEQGSQLGLFERVEDDDGEIRRVCVRLEGMLGQNMVMQAVRVGGRGPIEQIAYLPFGEPRSASVDRSTMPWPGRLPAPTPALVHRDLPEVVLLDGAGLPVRVDRRGTLSGEPAQLCLARGRELCIEGWSGPWPSEERWWDPYRAARRARLQLQLVDQRVLLVVLIRGSWHLEGEYD